MNSNKKKNVKVRKAKDIKPKEEDKHKKISEAAGDKDWYRFWEKEEEEGDKKSKKKKLGGGRKPKFFKTDDRDLDKSDPNIKIKDNNPQKAKELYKIKGLKGKKRGS